MNNKVIIFTSIIYLIFFLVDSSATELIFEDYVPRKQKVSDLLFHFETLIMQQKEEVERSTIKKNSDMPEIEDLFSLNQPFAVDREQASKRQVAIRRNGKMSLDDPATHIVNLFQLMEVFYPNSKRKSEKACSKLQNLNLRIGAYQNQLQEVNANLDKISKFRIKKIILKKKLKKRKKYILNNIKITLNEIDRINQKVSLCMVYNPEKVREDAFHLIHVICEYIPKNEILVKFIEVENYFD